MQWVFNYAFCTIELRVMIQAHVHTAILALRPLKTYAIILALRSLFNTGPGYVDLIRRLIN